MVKIKINFKEFVKILNKKVIQFSEGSEWDENDWNREYISFKEFADMAWDKEFVEKTDPKELVAEWAKSCFSENTPETHSCFINPKFIANEKIKNLINVDSLYEAEKITGKSYKKNKNTQSLGFFMHLEKSKNMAKLMDETGDTKFSDTEEDYLKKVKSFGFKSLLIIPFNNSKGIEERFHILFHYDYSILLAFDTFTWEDDGSWARSGKEVPPPSVNGGKFYYNWMPDNKTFPYSITGSGGCLSHGKSSYSCYFNDELEPVKLSKELAESEPKWKGSEKWEDYKHKEKIWREKCDKFFADKECKYIYSGHRDCREAIKFNINQLLEHGTFLKKWKEQPFLWLLTRDEFKGKEIGEYNTKEINEKKIAMLPKEVQELIKGEK